MEKYLLPIRVVLGMSRILNHAIGEPASVTQGMLEVQEMIRNMNEGHQETQ
jgi:hypothetical protein